MRKPKDKHGYDLKPGDMLYAHGYPDKPWAIVYSIDWQAKTVRLVENFAMLRYGFKTNSHIEIIESNTWLLSFKSINRSYWRRWPRSKDAGPIGKKLRTAKPYENRWKERLPWRLVA